MKAGFRSIRNHVVVRVRHSFKHDKIGGDASFPQFQVHARRIAEEEIPRPCGEQRGREAADVAVYGGEHGVFQIVLAGVQPRGIAQPAVITDQNIVHIFVGEVRIAGFAQIRPGRSRRKRRRKRQALRLGAQPQNQGHAAARGRAENPNLLRRRGLEQFPIDGHGVVDSRRIGEIGGHAIIGVDDRNLPIPAIRVASRVPDSPGPRT